MLLLALLCLACGWQLRLPHPPRLARPVLRMGALRPGQTLLAEVEDIVGGVRDPTALLRLRGSAAGTSPLARMSTAALRPGEKLALQTGAVMRVVVTRAEGDDLWVTLDRGAADPGPPAKPGKTPRKTPRTGKPALLLGDLKTGMALQGVVSSNTHYALFIDAKVSRPSKGGSFARVNGMLHSSDLHGLRKSELEKGSNLTVYVKEVFKNSGRFTLTLDPSISKAKIVEARAALKREGNERRRARRVRRMLDSVVVGDTVRGFVQDVVPEGVLVTVSSIGPLNVTGLVAKSDLPKQFEVPPDLKESFQRQLLQQDFVAGRQITCGVLRVAPRPQPRTGHRLALLLEELGPLIESDSISPDSLPAQIEDTDSEDTDVADEEDDADGQAVADIYHELRGSSPLLCEANLRAWGDLQDMVAEGALRPRDIDRAIAKATSGSKSPGLTLSQFEEVIDAIQDALDGVLDDEEEAENTPEVTQTKADTAAAQQDKADAENSGREEPDSDSELTLVLREAFDSLKDGAKGTVSLESFKGDGECIIEPRNLYDGLRLGRGAGHGRGKRARVLGR